MTNKTSYKGFQLNGWVTLTVDQKTDAGEIIPAGDRVQIVHITPSVRRERVYFFNCDIVDGKRVRPSADEVSAR